MNIILLENVRNLGKMGEVVNVKAGYARNYLVPQHKAVFATKKNIDWFEAQRLEFEKKAELLLMQAQQRAAAFSDITVVIEAQATDEGKLYGSIGISEIKLALDKRGIPVSKREIILTQGPMYAVGQYVIDLQLHSDVVVALHVEIVASK